MNVLKGLAAVILAYLFFTGVGLSLFWLTVEDAFIMGWRVLAPLSGAAACFAIMGFICALECIGEQL